MKNEGIAKKNSLEKVSFHFFSFSRELTLRETKMQLYQKKNQNQCFTYFKSHEKKSIKRSKSERTIIKMAFLLISSHFFRMMGKLKMRRRAEQNRSH